MFHYQTWYHTHIYLLVPYFCPEMSQKCLPTWLEVYGVRMGYTVVSHVPFTNVTCVNFFIPFYAFPPTAYYSKAGNSNENSSLVIYNLFKFPFRGVVYIDNIFYSNIWLWYLIRIMIFSFAGENIILMNITEKYP